MQRLGVPIHDVKMLENAKSKPYRTSPCNAIMILINFDKLTPIFAPKGISE